MLGKLKSVLSQSTHPVNETAEGVPCASGKKGGGRGKRTCTRRLPSLEFGSLWSSWLFILNEIICC